MYCCRGPELIAALRSRHIDALLVCRLLPWYELTVVAVRRASTCWLRIHSPELRVVPFAVCYTSWWSLVLAPAIIVERCRLY
jgi:hypothetical protein